MNSCPTLTRGTSQTTLPMTHSLEMDNENNKIKEEESYFRTRVDRMTRIQPSFSVQYQNMQIPSFTIYTGSYLSSIGEKLNSYWHSGQNTKCALKLDIV